jgi:cell division protein FtsA
VVPCGRRPRAIQQADIDRVLEVAGTVPLEPNREMLHVLAQRFSVDNGVAVESPLNMEAYKVEASVYIVTASAPSLANLRRCLGLAAVTPVGMTASVLAAAEAVLTPDERQLGVFVVDLGASSTGLACFVDSALVHVAVLPIGGRHMTTDLGLMLQTPLSEAEHIKITHGHVLPEFDDDAAEIDVTPFGDDQRRKTTRYHVSEVLAARADETAALVLAELDKVELSASLPAGAVLVGGGTELGGLPRRLSSRWGLPVRVGRPHGVVGLADAVRGPAHAAAVGLLLWEARGISDAAVPPVKGSEASGLAKLIDWARQAFLPGRNGRNWEGGAG